MLPHPTPPRRYPTRLKGRPIFYSSFCRLVCPKFEVNWKCLVCRHDRQVGNDSHTASDSSSVSSSWAGVNTCTRFLRNKTGTWHQTGAVTVVLSPCLTLRRCPKEWRSSCVYSLAKQTFTFRMQLLQQHSQEIDNPRKNKDKSTKFEDWVQENIKNTHQAYVVFIQGLEYSRYKTKIMQIMK